MLKHHKEYNGLQCVYRIVCLENDYAYVGQTRNLARRVREHIMSLRKGQHRNKRLQADYDRFGSEAFELEILYCGDNNLDEIEESEITACRENGKCYNVFSGGLSGYIGDEEFRKKISAAHKGRKLSDSERLQRSEKAKKQWQDKKYRDRMVSSAINQWSNEEYRRKMVELHSGNVNACGHKLTEEIVINARRRYNDGEKISDLANEYGVTYCTMRSAVTGRSWKHIS